VHQREKEADDKETERDRETQLACVVDRMIVKSGEGVGEKGVGKGGESVSDRGNVWQNVKRAERATERGEGRGEGGRKKR